VLQLWAYSLVSPQLYAEVQGGLLRELAAGEIGDYERLHADMHSLADVPAELFLDMMDWTRATDAWKGGGPVIAGNEIDAKRLRDVPVLTLESEQDELVGQGQTHALTRRLRLRRAHAATLPRARHHDLFTGPGFAAFVAPLLRRFYRALEG
jgi:poly-beta-hydroxyalkanoate depolymerase